MDPETEIGAEQIVAQQTGFFRIRDRTAHPADGQRILGAHINIAFIGFDRPRGDHHAFEHRVRIAFHDRTVHECARVAFVAVADHVFFLVFAGERELPLQSGRKTAAAMAAQPRFGHDLANLFRFHFHHRLAGAFVPGPGDVFLNVFRLDHAVGQNHPMLPVVEWNFGIALAAFAGTGIHIKQTLDHFPLLQRPLDDFRHIGHLDLGIQNVFRLDMHQRSLLAEPLTTGFGNIGAVEIVLRIGLDFDRDINTRFPQCLHQSIAHRHGAVGHTSRAAAENDPAGQFGRRPLVVGGDFFEIDIHMIPDFLFNNPYFRCARITSPRRLCECRRRSPAPVPASPVRALLRPPPSPGPGRRRRDNSRFPA
ncbi:hypothetical protein SDC9_118156 [bioreactor metagenome]|uniref:Uncharacterized protein n=1 Tax=bioreactor metagenome TaxID=1076179 RepID=A0A645C794_9ZZZZ